MASAVEGQHLGLPGVAAERERLHKSARAVVPIGVVEAHGVAGVRELVNRKAALESRPDAHGAKHLIGAMADGVARLGIVDRAAVAHRLDLVVVEALEFDIEVVCQQSLLRTELQGIGKRLLQTRQASRGAAVLISQQGLELLRKARWRSCWSAAGCMRPDPSELLRAPRSGAPQDAIGCGIEEQHADIDPLVSAPRLGA